MIRKDDEYGDQHRAFVQGEYLSCKYMFIRLQEICTLIWIDLDRFSTVLCIISEM